MMVTRVSKKKRKFKRQDYHMYKKLKRTWRRPRGRHSKLRKGKSGNSPKPRIGWSRAKNERGFVDGKKLVLVNNLGELAKIDKAENAAILISGKIGLKKLEIMFKKADELGLTILNKNRAKRISKRAKIRKFKEKKKEKKSKEGKAKEKKSKQLSDKVETVEKEPDQKSSVAGTVPKSKESETKEEQEKK